MSRSRRFKWYLTFLLVPLVFLLAFGVGGMAWFHFGNPADTCASVSYTHLTLPTKRIV